MRRLRLSFLIALMSAAPAGAADRYYVTVFSSQDGRGSPRHSHCFATFARVRTAEGQAAGGAVVEEFTISWMPGSGAIRLLARPERGSNYTYAQSIAWAQRNGLRTTSWGPFEMTPGGYQAAVCQYHRLQSGQIAYKALDRRIRPNAGLNCIHALTDIAPGPLLNTGVSRGDKAAAAIVRHFQPLLISSNSGR